MEKQMSDLSFIKNYRNRQVILNYYMDEDLLWKRDGFNFNSISIDEAFILFLKNDGEISISIKEYPTFIQPSDFQNYFILLNDTNRLEIYFP
ncbi:hypothetical protein RCG23_00950 [Neobacillus sp. PS3-34]|uniref:hypothetical protein n=1 Tax=Neobacillus sp. PS3-34 TaxID=3070678 RepID=UPI0027DF78E6|nr:hypothetical protein [Neobacillus sp. PS3-34]WML48744.1 hypothetical protein RCG23_00950 [Neobacillus sp. PS3-34]